MGAALDTVDDILQHYGVKGMRWGVRRTRAQIDADSADATKKKATQAKISRNKTTDVLSNEELRQLNDRLNLEQNYISLMQRQEANRPKTPLEKGSKWAAKMTTDIANQSIKNIVSKQITNQVSTAIDNKMTAAEKKKK